MKIQTFGAILLAFAAVIFTGCYGAYPPYGPPPIYPPGGQVGPPQPPPYAPGPGPLPPKSVWTQSQANAYSSARTLGAKDAKWGLTPDFGRHADAYAPHVRGFASEGYSVGYAQAAGVGGGGQPNWQGPGNIKY